MKYDLIYTFLFRSSENSEPVVVTSRLNSVNTEPNSNNIQ